jgi:23S rRNA pseudouridine1911/1915/1917 synthase
MRLDQAVAARFPEISRRKARELIAARRVLVNDRPMAIASREVSGDARIVVVGELPELEVIRETPDWIAVNKPAALPVQPTRDRAQRSLEELMRIRFREVYLVHRLDTNTTGVVVFARTRAAAARLSALFAGGEIRKTYLAVVEGELANKTSIDSPIGGKHALTSVKPLASANGVTLIEAEIETGRTHQIRIHLASIGHPVIGDRRYGATWKAPRPMLHAWKLEHALLGSLEAPPPDDLIRCAPPRWKTTPTP